MLSASLKKFRSLEAKRTQFLGTALLWGNCPTFLSIGIFIRSRGRSQLSVRAGQTAQGEWLCKLSRDLLTLFVAIFFFSQGAAQVNAYIPDAIWYDYETVSEAARWAHRPPAAEGSSQVAVLGA